MGMDRIDEHSRYRRPRIRIWREGDRITVEDFDEIVAEHDERVIALKEAKRVELDQRAVEVCRRIRMVYISIACVLSASLVVGAYQVFIRVFNGRI